VFTSQPMSGTDGASFPWQIMELESSPSMPRGSSSFSNGCTLAINIPAAALDWRSASEWWSRPAAASGWSNPRLAGDPPFALPFPRRRPEQEHPDAAAPAREPIRILLIEDNPTDVFVIREVLKEIGLPVQLQTAENGQEALQFFEETEGEEGFRCPSLVLLDLNLPRLSGLEVLRRLRSGERCKETRVIVVTSSSAEEDRVGAERLGANAYFQKPADLKSYRKLAEVVRKVLAQVN
jgi:CheY-like chemotaxis protein